MITIEAVEKFARIAHKANYRLSGDGYATAEELELILNDPLAFYDMVQDQITLTLGVKLYGRSVEKADDLDLDQAVRNEASRLNYISARRFAK
jgi:hypothetical protein